jgi:hypothetical protein
MDFMLTAKVIVFSTYKSRMTPNNIRYLNYRPFRRGKRKVLYLIKFSRHFNFAYLSKFANLAKLNITRNFYDLQYLALRASCASSRAVAVVLGAKRKYTGTRWTTRPLPFPLASMPVDLGGRSGILVSCLVATRARHRSNCCWHTLQMNGKCW